MISIKDEMLTVPGGDLNKTVKSLFKKKTNLLNRFKSNTNTIKTSPIKNDNDNNNNKISDNEKSFKLKDKFECCGKDETPEHLQRDYILNGYRVNFSFLLSLKSMFIPKHNDFANIHTHFIPALYFIYLFYDIILSENSKNIYGLENWLDYLAFGVFLISGLTTFICSTLYHTFGCHSLPVYSKLLVCDYLGIIFLIGSSFYPSLIYAFKGHPKVMLFYCSTITVLCLSLIIFVLVPRFKESNKLRNLLFVLTAGFGIIPTIHMLYIHPLEYLMVFIYRILGMFVLYGGGLLIYIYKIPEKWFPGMLDNIITSHSIWHIFVFVAPLYHLQTCLMANQITK